jgi:hypothetical protein
MPPRNTSPITLAQLFALILIWGGVAYGLLARDEPGANATQVAHLTACR